MLKETLGTPLYAAFFCAVVLSACTSQPEDAENPCTARHIPISSVQGDGYTSPIAGQQVIVRGVVNLIQDNLGLYVEESNTDNDPKTSNALFIQTAQLPNDIVVGSLIGVQGTVEELGERRDTLTALTDISAINVCAQQQTIPLTDIKLPIDSSARESLESMRIRIEGPLVATDVYQFAQGNITLSGNGRQFISTEIMTPGAESTELLARNRAFALPVKMPENMTFAKTMMTGASIDQVTGVMAHDDRGKRVSLEHISNINVADLLPLRSAGAGSLRIVGMNLHNYFNGDGKDSGFPTPRGAKTVEEFKNQSARIGAAIKQLNPHVVAVMELENDGFGADSAAQDFIQLAEKATSGKWLVTRPVDDNTGTDKIAVGIFYRSDQLKAIGPANILTGPEFERSRQPQAQLFEHLGNGEKLVIVINHLKSKGSCPETGMNADQKDGQGCWNPMRQSSAELMSAWAKDVASSAGTDNILILGDMNAYRNEDPITAIRQAGFTELMDQAPGQEGQQHPYSFVYFGQHGTLDYAFSSPALLENVQQAFIWNVNAALPGRMSFPQPWLRFSDHDPVVVDLFWRHSKTSD